MSAADDLLLAVEPLSHGERRRFLATFTGDPAVVAGLARRGPYERRLAVHLAVALGDGGQVARAVLDPDPSVAGLAARAARRLGLPDDLLAEVVRSGSPFARALIYRAIRGSGQADGLIDEVRERWGDAEAARLLLGCSREAVGARLDDLAHAVRGWATLAKRHPRAFLDHAERTLAWLQEGSRPAWWRRCGDGVTAAAAREPVRVITLIERFWVSDSFPTALTANLRRLLSADTRRTLALLLAPERRISLESLVCSTGANRLLAKLPETDLIRVARALRGLAVEELLRAVAPSRREALFDAATEELDLSATALPGSLLTQLPFERRTAEARRMLTLTEVRDWPERTAEITSFLPFPEAEPELRAWTRRSNAEQRAVGYRLLIACAAGSRSSATLTTLLDSLDRLRNEQDPVRLAALSALTAVPVRLFAPEQLPAIDRLVAGLRDARDASEDSRGTLHALLLRLMERDDLREGVVGHLELASVRNLEELASERKRLLVAALAGQIREQTSLDRYSQVFGLIRKLGRDWHGLVPLEEAVKHALGSARDFEAREAVSLWLEAPHTRSERLEALVRAEPSAAVLPSVFTVLARHRTDLLDVALTRPAGRFAKGRPQELPYAQESVRQRWTPRQLAAYLEAMREVAANDKLSVYERGRAVQALAASPDLLAPHLTAPEPWVRRAALTALQHTPQPRQALADLLAQAMGDDAHVAMNSTVRAARFVLPADLAAALAPVLAEGKITARKEAVRLLAQSRAEGAAATMLRLWEEPGQHQDVRVAIVASCARYLLDAPETWTIFGAITPDQGEVLAPLVAAGPLDMPSLLREPYGRLVIVATRSADGQLRATAVGTLSRWAPYVPDALTRLADVVEDLADTATWRLAAVGLAANAASGPGAAELERVVVRLAAMPPDPDAEPERDRPARRRLALLVELLGPRNRLVPGGLHYLAEGLAFGPAHGGLSGLVAGLPRHGTPELRLLVGRLLPVLPEALAAELSAATIDWTAPERALDGLTELDLGVLTTESIGRRLADSLESIEPGVVLPHATRLAASEGRVAGQLACALVAACGAGTRWSPPWRALLRRLRASRWPDVAYRATEVFTAEE